jgi:hypothetical protein
MPHKIDLLLDCGHIIYEDLEAAIFTPETGEKRECSIHKEVRTVQRVGVPFWTDDEKEQEKEKEKK